jgi:hypothetical protein
LLSFGLSALLVNAKGHLSTACSARSIPVHNQGAQLESDCNSVKISTNPPRTNQLGNGNQQRASLPTPSETELTLFLAPRVLLPASSHSVSAKAAPPKYMLLLHDSISSEGSQLPGSQMAYQRADPHPFNLRGFHAMVVQNREIMSRAVIRHSHRSHEDFTIVSVTPLPAQPLQFTAIREVLHEFFEDQLSIEVREIQPSHLGQALVRFANAHDRDMLVNQSPHQFGDVLVHLVRHNQVRSWRQINFNRECWLMLMGFPLDFWNHECIQNTLAAFGKVLLWENDQSFLTRLMVKARVTKLYDVPHFVVVTESEGF